MMTFGILAAIWIVCSIICYGWVLGFNQREFPSLAEKGYKRDRVYAAIASLFGPIGLLSAYMTYYKPNYKYITYRISKPYHGLMFFRERERTIKDFLMPQRKTRNND